MSNIPHTSQLEKMLKKSVLDLKPNTLFTYNDTKAYTVKSAKPIANGTKIAIQTTTKMIVLSLSDVAKIKIVESKEGLLKEKSSKAVKLQTSDAITLKAKVDKKVANKLDKASIKLTKTKDEDSDIFKLSTKEFCEKWSRSASWVYQRRWHLTKDKSVEVDVKPVKSLQQHTGDNVDTIRKSRHVFTEDDDSLILSVSVIRAATILNVSTASIYQRKAIIQKKRAENSAISKAWSPKQHDIATVADDSIEVAVLLIVNDCQLAHCQVVKSKDDRFTVGMQMPIPVKRLKQLSAIST